MCGILLVMTMIGGGNASYCAVIGMLSSGIEALLGIPQFWLNY